MKLSQLLNDHRSRAAQATLETIDFQRNDSFGPNLQALFSQFEDAVINSTEADMGKKLPELVSQFEKMVESRFGLKVQLVIDDRLASVFPNMYVPRNVMVAASYRNYYSKSKNGAVGETKALPDLFVMGSVDLRTAKVSGWFSERTAIIHLNMVDLFMYHHATAGEVTALALHEIGHIFSAIEYISRTNTTNQVLADIAKASLGSGPEKSYDYIYSKLSGKKDAKEIAARLSSSNRIVSAKALIDLSMRDLSLTSSGDSHDNNSFESQADVFVARFGYAKENMSILDKFETSAPEYMEDREITRMLVSSAMFCAGAACTFIAFASVIPVIGAVYYFFSIFFLRGLYINLSYLKPSSSDFTYDRARARFTRSKNQLIQSLKEDNLPREVKVDILEQIRFIEDTLNYIGQFDSKITAAWAKLIPGEGAIINSIALQQEIEAMASNDIFTSATRLSLKGQ